MRSYDRIDLSDSARSETPSADRSVRFKREEKPSTVSDLLDRLQAKLSSIAVPVGREVTNGGQHVYWDPNPDYGSANPHLMIIGESGFGKTYTMQCLVAELAQRCIPSIVIDYGRGFDLEAAPKEFID